MYFCLRIVYIHVYDKINKSRFQYKIACSILVICVFVCFYLVARRKNIITSGVLKNS